MNSKHTTSQLKPTPRAIHFRTNSNQMSAKTKEMGNSDSAPQSLQGKQAQECLFILSNN